MYLTLSALKKHLNIDESFKDDDAYLVDLIDVAEAAVSRAIDQTFEDLQVQNSGELPSPVLHAVKLMVGNFYANRESVAYASTTEVPKSYDYLIDLYRNYGQQADGGQL